MWPNADGSGLMRILYIFFLGVVPFISISLFLMYYWHQNRPWFISQPPTNEYVSNSQPDVVPREMPTITDHKLVFSTNEEVWPHSRTSA